MKKMLIALFVIFLSVGGSVLLAQYVKEPQLEVFAGDCCPDRDETGTGLQTPKTRQR
jgi:hypothetical protein